MSTPSGDREHILAPEYNLRPGVSELKGRDGATYLQFASHMVTFYQQTYGELSRFFQALREGRLLGSRCTKCRQVMVPAATWHCPDCDFAAMEPIDLPHRGVLAATAPITIFPSSSFIGMAPFARGYVDVATDAKVASFMPARLETTTGLPRPGIFVKGVRLKLVFEDERQGTIRDCFWVPESEIPAALLDRQPLLASALDFSSPPAPAVKRDPTYAAAFTRAVAAVQGMAANVAKSPRAQADLAGRTHAIGVRTGGGECTLRVAGGNLEVRDGIAGEPDFTMVADDPAFLARWAADGSLTDAAVEGTLWLPNRAAFAVLPVLDRLPRSIRRDLRDRA